MKNILIFSLGAAAGSLLTWKLIEKKYKKIADEEIESVREYYKNKIDGTIKTSTGLSIVEPVKETESTTTTASYTKLINDLEYSNQDSNQDDDYTIYIEPGVDFIEPYVISPEEFGEVDAYETKSWTYYSDFVLTDEEGEIVSDPENIIGDALSHFGDYEDDSVYVRNENTFCDYEILKHCKTFSEVNGSEMNV